MHICNHDVACREKTTKKSRTKRSHQAAPTRHEHRRARSLLSGRGDEHPNASGVQAMVSAVDVAKRALVTLLLRVAALYSLTLGVKRDSPDSEVKRAFRSLSKRTHPDRGGDKASQQDLNNAYTTWETAARDGSGEVALCLTI